MWLVLLFLVLWFTAQKISGSGFHTAGSMIFYILHVGISGFLLPLIYLGKYPESGKKGKKRRAAGILTAIFLTAALLSSPEITSELRRLHPSIGIVLKYGLIFLPVSAELLLVNIYIIRKILEHIDVKERIFLPLNMLVSGSRNGYRLCSGYLFYRT